MDVKIGSLIKIIKMDGNPYYNGKIGIVTYIDSMNQLHGTWGGCAVLYTDVFVVLRENTDE
ncbi:MAG: hypothetical protein NC087_04270 [Anaeroplasma bactoclasticum]|nr:hypothetical protein [Anaeroplasma bactoclasticum]